MDAFGFAEVAEDAGEEGCRGELKRLAKADDVAFGGSGRRFKEVGDFDDAGVGGVGEDGAAGGGVMDDDSAGGFGDAAEERIAEIAGIDGGTGALSPEFGGEIAVPFAVIVDKFLDIRFAIEDTEEEMVEIGVVEDGDAGGFEGALVDVAVEGIVAEVVEMDAGAGGVQIDTAMGAEGWEEFGGVVGDAGAGGRERRVEADGHVDFLRRRPNRAVPTRMWVAPSSTAASKSWDMPMEVAGRLWTRASCLRRRK